MMDLREFSGIDEDDDERVSVNVSVPIVNVFHQHPDQHLPTIYTEASIHA
jgi:hypothetical protein